MVRWEMARVDYNLWEVAPMRIHLSELKAMPTNPFPCRCSVRSGAHVGGSPFIHGGGAGPFHPPQVGDRLRAG